MPQDSLFAVGTTGLIYAVDDDYVVKRRSPSKFDRDFTRKAFSIESRVYKRLGAHPSIAKFRDITEDSIELERGTCLRQRIQTPGYEDIPFPTKLQWAQQAADGLRYVHENGIVHADVGCHNMILDRSDHVKLIDFAGSGIDHEPAIVCYEWCSYCGGDDVNIQTDIFAFGSTLFEIESGHVPYHQLSETLEWGPMMRRVEELFAAREYPDEIEGMVLGDIIVGCWDGRYETMEQVQRDLALLDVK